MLSFFFYFLFECVFFLNYNPESITFGGIIFNSKTEYMNIERPLKTNILFGIVLFLCTGIFKTSLAQETDTIVPVNKDPEKILRKIDAQKINRNGFNFWQERFSGHWAGVDFGFNTFVNKDYSGYDSEFMKNDVFRSNSTYVNLIQQSIGLQHNRNTIGLVTGLGLHLQSYRLDKNTTIERGPNDVIEPKTLFFDQNQKSKLSVVSVMVPLLAEFQVPVHNYENRTSFFNRYFWFVQAKQSHQNKIPRRPEKGETENARFFVAE